MASFCAQALVYELETLINTLRAENHPALRRFEPFYRDPYIGEVRNCLSTLSCIRQELAGLQSSMQNLTMLVVAQQQQLYHPSNCQQFSLYSVPTAQPQIDVSGLAPVPSSNFRNKSTKRKKPARKQSVVQDKAVPTSSAPQPDPTLEQLIEDCQINYYNMSVPGFHTNQ